MTAAVPVEKMQELDAVVKFWRARVDALTSELGILNELKTHGKPSGDRYAADRLLREIKRKVGEIDAARHSLDVAERDRVAASDFRHRVHDSMTTTGSGRSAH